MCVCVVLTRRWVVWGACELWSLLKYVIGFDYWLIVCVAIRLIELLVIFLDFLFHFSDLFNSRTKFTFCLAKLNFGNARNNGIYYTQKKKRRNDWFN